MMVPFSNLGVGSGLPLDKLLADLRVNESRALGVIKTRYDATQGRISAYAKLKAAVETVRTAGEALGEVVNMAEVNHDGGLLTMRDAYSLADQPGCDHQHGLRPRVGNFRHATGVC